MNNKALRIYLKLFPLSKSTENNQGFVLPMMIGLGLIMTLVGLTMIGRSSDEQMTSISQTQSAQALAASETGVTEVMNFLNTVPALADKDISKEVKDNGIDKDEYHQSRYWPDEYDRVEGTLENCDDLITYKEKLNAYVDSAESADSSEKEDTWITINNGKDRFRVLNYDYIADDKEDIKSAGEGILTIEAEANFDQNSSTSVLEVTIPVQPLEDSTPGLYVKKADLSNNKIEGNLLLDNCDLASGGTIDTDNIDGDATADPFVEFPDLPELPSDYKTIDAITKKKDFEDLTTASDSFNEHEDDDILQFPLNDDDPQDSDGVYHYLWGVDTSQNNSISLNGGNKTIRIKPGEKVTFYLQGDIDLSGNANIIHACKDAEGNTIFEGDCELKPTNFQIFGGDGDDKPDEGGYKGGTTEFICLSGSSRVQAFIFAPEADVGVGGGGKDGNDGVDKSNAGITGTVWADSWNDECGSNASKTLVTQNASWDELPVSPQRKIAPASRWKRKNVGGS